MMFSNQLKHGFTAFLHSVVIMEFLFHSTVLARLPEDLQPISIYGVKDVDVNPVFRGTLLDGSSSKLAPMLRDFQSMEKIGRNFYVYGRNYIFVIDMTTMPIDSNIIPHKQAVEWISSDEDKKLCIQKGQSEEKCQNYIKIFEKKFKEENHIVVCSTNAFNPTCRLYQMLDDGKLMLTDSVLSGSLLCPYDPSMRVASAISDGSLYTATKAGFNGRDSLIHRHSSLTNQYKNLRTPRGERTMLNDPTFFRITNGGRSLNKVHVFFTETSVEDDTNQIYTRVGQACKNDEGGTNLLRNQFTSFFKARLNCSLPGHPPFYFNEMQDVSDLLTLNSWYKVGNTKLVFAIMNTPRNSIPASAICAFTLDDIESSLSGPFKEKFTRGNSRKTYWDAQESFPRPHLASCQSNPRKLTDSKLNFVRKHPIMYKSVPAWNLVDKVTTEHGAKPLLTITNSREFLTTLTVDTEAGSTSLYTVLILGSESGKIIKVLLLLNGKVEMIEERLIFSQEQCGNTSSSVQKISLDKESGAMIVAFQNCVIRASLCPLATVCGRKCIKSRDPYCGWDGDRCVTVDRLYANNNETTRAVQPRQDVINGNIDGMPDCDKALLPVKREDSLPDVTVPPRNSTIDLNVTKAFDGALLGDGEPLSSAAGSSAATILGIGIGCLLLGTLIGCLVSMLYRKLAKHNKSTEKEEMEAIYAKEDMGSGGVDIRRISTNSNPRKSRHISNGSHHNQNRHSNPRSSTHEEMRLKHHRAVTESSLGNRSDDGTVFTQHEDIISPETPYTRDVPDSVVRLKQIQSTSSSVGGRRRARNSKPSTSSIPDNPDTIRSPGNRQVNSGYPANIASVEPSYDDNAFADDDDLGRQGSNDSGNGSEGLTTPPEVDTFNENPPPSKIKPRSVPGRSMSLQGHHLLPMQRTYSVDANGTGSMGHNRPHIRGVLRQHSLQPNDLAHKQLLLLQQRQSQQPVYRPQALPANIAQPGWTNQPPAPVNVVPHKNYMTHSLDRRRKPKGQASFPDVFSESFDESKPIGAPAPVSPRKRYLSESEKSTKLPMSRPAVCQAIHEEREPLLHYAPAQSLHDPQSLRNMMSLNVAPTYPGSPSEQGVFNPPSGKIIPNSRRFPGRMVSHSSPDTPIRDGPPNFNEQRQMLANSQGHTTLPIQKNHHIPHHLRLPSEVQHRLVLPNESPSKSHPPSPMHDLRPPSFPSHERVRRGSGSVHGMQFPHSPGRKNAPVVFEFPSCEPQLSNIQRTNYPSSGNSTIQNDAFINGLQFENQPQTVSPETPLVRQTTIA